MSVLVINCGSSSIKYQLLDVDDPKKNHSKSNDLRGLIEQIGTIVPDHTAALRMVANDVTEHLKKHKGTLTAIGHRVVHGGAQYSAPTLITNDVIDTIDRLSVLAPLHNPASNDGIRAASESFPDVPQVAVFDTAFHMTIPQAHKTYAVPEEWVTKYGVQRYGFHGTSHMYVSQLCTQWLHSEHQIIPANSRIVVLHLGNGASACAVKGGESIDTSMGLTPLPGLVMGTRSGDVDPAVFGHLHRVAGMSIDEIDFALNRQSGLLGVAGVSDMRVVEERINAGDKKAELAMGIYIHRIVSTVGAYAAILGGLDAVAFTAGVGENSSTVRARIAKGLSGFGIKLDDGLNRNLKTDPSIVKTISSATSSAALLVVPTNEELEIANQTLSALT